MIQKITVLLLLYSFTCNIFAQEPVIRGVNGQNSGRSNNTTIDRYGNTNRSAGKGKTDSLKKRDKNADSITISYRYMDDAKRYFLDSSIIDYKRFATQPNYITLGNNGSSSKPILFTPILKAGFEEGKNALDAYRWNINTVKFYKTTRPYTELGYVLGSKAEQNIHLTHTQNVKKDWNIAVDYRLISAPGYFRNQKNNHNNVAITSYYQGKRKRYANWFAYISNSIKASDYGGVKYDSTLLDPSLKDRSFIETNLNNNVFTTRNPFDNKLESGQFEKDKSILFKQSYDIGKKDSIVVNDSLTNYLFYPKLRLEHTISVNNQSYLYKGLVIDSAYYIKNYKNDTLFKKSNGYFESSDAWKNVVNDFSLLQFPDTKNTLQFIKAGISYENWKGTFTDGTFRTRNRNFSNLFTHFEYRNRTRNKKWDINANASFYINGYNAGDYDANASLIRKLSSKLGDLKLQFQNVNRTPSFILYNESAFNYKTISSLKKENTTQLTAEFFNEKKEQNITAQLLISTNLITWQGFTTYQQEQLFNMLKITFERSFHLNKKFVWHTDAVFQKVITGSPKINYPTLYTRNRIAYEGNFGKKNLRIATGLEFRYLLPYKLDAWSPVTGQFYYQDSASSKKNLPDINAYLHFSITSFNAFVRVENLNTAVINTGVINPGLLFINNNKAVNLYPNPGLVIRLGIYWRFVN